ncbi:hypothetical protein NE237_002051 [Protea cynaroides]|uniref:Uncharacterized protein n=1 Tax=Protea cynaroides TaxID=273540 RepID=A0A9Q0QYP3_9MAGN|nr:hypothetical protein NE237_002051 [Protea cynaroides]
MNHEICSLHVYLSGGVTSITCNYNTFVVFLFGYPNPRPKLGHLSQFSGCISSKGRPVIRKLDPLNHLEGTSALDQSKDSSVATQASTQWRQMGNDEKMTAVQSEMTRVNQLPVNSSYATHRKRVLNKVWRLLSVQRSKAQEEELELLFATLSL